MSREAGGRDAAGDRALVQAVGQRLVEVEQVLSGDLLVLERLAEVREGPRVDALQAVQREGDVGGGGGVWGRGWGVGVSGAVDDGVEGRWPWWDDRRTSSRRLRLT